MEKRRPPSMVFHGPVQGVHTGDVHGSISYTQNNYAPDDVLRALSVLLEDRTIEWDQPSLEEPRVIIGRAVTQENINDPQLRPALSTVLTHVGHHVALAVLGNSAYDILKTFAGIG